MLSGLVKLSKCLLSDVEGREPDTDLPDWVHLVAAQIGDDPGDLPNIVLLDLLLLHLGLEHLILLVLHGAVKYQRHPALF